MDRTSLRQRLAEVEAKITGVQHQIGEQRQVIVKLEGAGCPADHAKYLLAGLELLQAAYRDSRTAMLAEFVQPGDERSPDAGRTCGSFADLWTKLADLKLLLS
jgi:hypothetical protein